MIVEFVKANGHDVLIQVEMPMPPRVGETVSGHVVKGSLGEADYAELVVEKVHYEIMYSETGSNGRAGAICDCAVLRRLKNKTEIE